MKTDLEEIKKISITEYARQMGFTPVKIGSYYTLKEHDSVRIDPRKNIFFRNSTGDRGTVIDFVMAFKGVSCGEAIKLLCDEIELPKVYKEQDSVPQKKKELILPAKARNMKNVFAYLVKTRCINQKIVQEMVDRDMLYQDERNNCVFVSRDENGKSVFATVRGTNTDKKWVGDVSGCDYSHSFFIDNCSRNLIVTESIIDAMSMMDIKEQKGENHQEYNYLSVSGLGKSREALGYHLGKTLYDIVFLAFDNDDKGREIAKEMKKHIESINQDISVSMLIPEAAKDWNEELQKEKGCFRHEEGEILIF
ncbi:DUF3991 and TOPRIM domain-containing protein [Mogibacterium timidum]|uniref:Toprim domain protein n=1 Tax=Mogibacterium timidum ATCC 33093 TaxID=1401079 RepID=X8IPH4_9FIRM|nr:DUF3991 and TOPRIM domain-containing protein [Mogibacterium timidum]EUC51730.1 toprim domain protein [Mogibacterium timidum ATCC 33093]